MNIKARLELALQLEKLKNTDITIDEFEENYFKLIKKMEQVNDPESLLIEEVFFQVWQLYDDFSDEYFDATNEVCVNTVKRFICFLRSSEKFEWPRLSNNFYFFLVIFTCGFYRIYRRKQLEKFGDLDAWPFRYIEQARKSG